jgi:uncharacterized protein (DUF2141 family)
MKMVFAPMAAMLAVATLMTGAAMAQPVAAIGPDATYCVAGAKVPAAMFEVNGLKDRTGEMRIELYPDNDNEFLGDRHKLVAEGKTFIRLITTLPAEGPVNICLKLPGEGRFAIAVIHQRGETRSFSFSKDGIGFPNNPRLYLSKPDVDSVAMTFGAGVTRVPVTLNYKSGLSMRPLPVK